MIREPPVSAGGDQVTSADRFLAVAVPISGAPGAERGVTLLDSPEVAPVPAAVTAATRNRYAVPLASPGTVVCDTAPTGTVCSSSLLPLRNTDTT